MEIQCICGIKYNKKQFKQHFRNCNHFLEKYKDFDFKISTAISKLFQTKKNSLIIIFLLERYIKLIKHKNKDNELNIKRSLSIKKYNANPPSKDKDKRDKSIDNNINNKNSNIQNFLAKLNYKTCNDFPKSKQLDNCFIRNNCIIKKKNNNQLYNKLRVFQKMNEISFELLKQKDIPTTFIENPFYKFRRNFGNNNNQSESPPNNPLNISFNLKYVGSKIINHIGQIIIDNCKSIYTENNGIINNQITNYLITYFKSIFNGEWFIIIYNIEYNEIWHNFTSFINDKSIVFSLGNKLFYVICYYCY